MPAKDYNEYMAGYMLRRYHQRRADAIRQLGEKCVVCDTIEELEIDHIDPALKSFSIPKLWSVSQKRFDEELLKCQLLCKEHHLEKSKREGSFNKSWTTKPRLVHGSKWTYKHHKCRCTLCVEKHGPKRTIRQHGERRTYMYGCKCELCRKANSDYIQAYTKKKRAGSKIG